MLIRLDEIPNPALRRGRRRSSLWLSLLVFEIYNYSIRTALAFTLMLFCIFSLAHADNKLSLHKKLNGTVCNVSGECALDIGCIAKNILLACETPKVEVAWNRTKNNVFLIACDCECTSHDNTGWLVDKDIAVGEHKVWKLHLGKKYTVEELGRPMINIPDLFHSHPLCNEPDKRLLKASVFVSLVK